MSLNNLRETEGAIARIMANAGELRMAAWKRLSVFYRFGRWELLFVLFGFFPFFLIAMFSILLHPEPAGARERLEWMITSSFRLKLGAFDKMNSANGEVVQFFVTCSPGGTFEASRTIKDNRSSEVVFPNDFIDKITGSKGSYGTACLVGENSYYTWRIVIGGKVIDSGEIKSTCQYGK